MQSCTGGQCSDPKSNRIVGHFDDNDHERCPQLFCIWFCLKNRNYHHVTYSVDTAIVKKYGF